MKIKNLIIVSGVFVITSCVVSKKKYTELELQNAKLKKDLAEAKNPTVDLNNEVTNISYSLGVNVANSIKNQGMESIDTAAVAKAMGAVFAGKKTEIEPLKAQQTLQTYFGELQNKMIEKQSEEGAKFLALNSMKEGVVSLPSGLQYKIIKKGNGPIPKASDKVKTHYHGTLVDGTVFDSSVKRGQPATFGVTQVIKGWQEALQIMPVGSKWELYIPHHLAYGAQGKGSIGPYNALIFQIELLEIIK